MISNFERFVALRYLRSKRKEVFISIITVISLLAVAISVMVLNIVMSVMTGFESELQAKLINANAHIVIRDYVGQLESWKPLSEELRSNSAVKSLFPYTYNQAMLSTTSGAARGLIIRGVEDTEAAKEKVASLLPQEESIEYLFSHQTIEVERPDGSLSTAKLPPIIVGRALQQQLALQSGSLVTLYSPQLSASPHGVIPRMKRFVVVDFYKSGLMEYEAGLAYVSLADAQSFFKLGDTVTGLELVVNDVTDAQNIAGELKAQLSTVNPRLMVTDWTEPNKALWDAIRLEKRVYFIVLLLLILIASFSVVSTLVMVVMEKSKDIAVLKTIGASDRTIQRIFLLQGAVIGTLGTLFGTLLGYLGCIGLREYGFKIDESVFSLSEVPVHMELDNFLTIACASLIITSLAGIYPAKRAAKIQPAETLRYE